MIRSFRFNYNLQRPSVFPHHFLQDIPFTPDPALLTMALVRLLPSYLSDLARAKRSRCSLPGSEDSDTDDYSFLYKTVLRWPLCHWDALVLHLSDLPSLSPSVAPPPPKRRHDAHSHFVPLLFKHPFLTEVFLNCIFPGPAPSLFTLLCLQSNYRCLHYICLFIYLPLKAN